MTISNLKKMAESYPNGYKTLWEKEKLLITSNFSFSLSVFKRLVSQGRQKVSLCGNGLITAYSDCIFFSTDILDNSKMAIVLILCLSPLWHDTFELSRFYCLVKFTYKDQQSDWLKQSDKIQV